VSSKTTGKTILDIKINKDMASIVFDDEVIKIPNDLIGEFNLFKGKELSQDDILKLKHEASLSEGFKIASSILKRKLVPESILVKKMVEKGISENAAKEIKDFFVRNCVISDEGYIEDMLCYYDEMLYGEYRIKSDLLKKGIRKEDINNIEFDFDNEIRKAKEYLKNVERKFKSSKHPYESIKNSLVVRGFSYDVINEVLGGNKNEIN